MLLLLYIGEVLVMLSCHSSNQGQVFSCTPSSITVQCQFEEFCSLHDFVCTCQESLSSHLIGIHLSSCFTLKMDSSHRVQICITFSCLSDVCDEMCCRTGLLMPAGSQVYCSALYLGVPGKCTRLDLK